MAMFSLACCVSSMFLSLIPLNYAWVFWFLNFIMGLILGCFVMLSTLQIMAIQPPSFVGKINGFRVFVELIGTAVCHDLMSAIIPGNYDRYWYLISLFFLCQLMIMMGTYFVDLRRIYLHNNKQFEEWVLSKTKRSWIDSISSVIALALASSETKQKVATHREVYAEATETENALDNSLSPLSSALLAHIGTPPMYSLAGNGNGNDMEIEIGPMDLSAKNGQELDPFDYQFIGDSLP
ncbi:hypothetical protein RFI_11999 [Reticulomyxa filosa]|uniref:Uncharacterized protein n=1 Tax=Reticulomyxa filosa TaxID=46433 RepID=X6NFP6_RETFI|nr:hypothetical protein RFI_11999 [Reticulomyxa filosa]|eukprot:ETO25145.1 hypothetical protein RFI_11999 [Reticulomyxa filosa]